MGVWMDRAFRDSLHERDGWKCRDCGRAVGRGPDDAPPTLGKIKAFQGEGMYGKARKFELNHQPDNLRTLCIPCNKMNISRLAWERAGNWKRVTLRGSTWDLLTKLAIKRDRVNMECFILEMIGIVEPEYKKRVDVEIARWFGDKTDAAARAQVADRAAEHGPAAVVDEIPSHAMTMDTSAGSGPDSEPEPQNEIV